MARAHGAAITEADIREDASICNGHTMETSNQRPEPLARREQKVSSTYTEGDERPHDTACNGGESAGHYRVDL